MSRYLATAAIALALTAGAPALAQDDSAAQSAQAELSDTDGNAVGNVSLTQTASGVVLVHLELDGAPAGTHAVHIHETGDCSAGDFTSAGGHVAGDAQHGVMVEGGPHPGDLPNITVPESGQLTVEFFNDRLDLAGQVFDEDGAAFIMHSGEDDYESQPSGDAGDRLACGAFEESS